MGKKLFVGNLSFSTTDQSLSDTFSQYGTVESSKVVTDRDTGRSRGFGFVEMSNNDEASQAITGLNGANIDGRAMTVNEAKPQAPRDNRSGFGGGNRGSGNRW